MVEPDRCVHLLLSTRCICGHVFVVFSSWSQVKTFPCKQTQFMCSETSRCGPPADSLLALKWVKQLLACSSCKRQPSACCPPFTKRSLCISCLYLLWNWTDVPILFFFFCIKKCAIKGQKVTDFAVRFPKRASTRKACNIICMLNPL